ncbi:MAG: methyltransferase domain-containing protein [Alphaproteobacteria bacterium]|nr:methyltransferase domain-containing protein [Alphaproteobacteria bacterium]
MTELDLLLDLHLDGDRQGPGTQKDTLRALYLSALDERSDLYIADIGCGTGGSTLVLAEELDAKIVAVDFLQPFLDKLHEDAAKKGLTDKVETLCASMDALPFEENCFDAIWSEGAIYNLGFDTGLKTFRPFLKPGGILAASELTWLTDARPAELDTHWNQHYPDIATAGEKILQIERNGFTLLGYFVLPPSSWFDTYYRPLQARYKAFLDRHDHSDLAKAVVQENEDEIALYEAYQDYVSYGFYIMKKTGA